MDLNPASPSRSWYLLIWVLGLWVADLDHVSAQPAASPDTTSVRQTRDHWNAYSNDVDRLFNETLEAMVGDDPNAYRKAWLDYYRNAETDALTQEVENLENTLRALTLLQMGMETYQDKSGKVAAMIEMIRDQINLAYEPRLQRGSYKSNGVKLRYYLLGTGKPVLILSGGPGTWGKDLLPVAELLDNASYRSILFDQRGTGESKLKTYDEKTINLQAYVDDIEGLRKHLKLEQWIILGHSWGGRLAMAYAAEYPDRVQSLILVGSGGAHNNYSHVFSKNIQTRQQDLELAAYYFWTNPYRMGMMPDQALVEQVRSQLPSYMYDRSKVLPLFTNLGEEVFNPRTFQIARKIKLTSSVRKNLQASFTQPVLVIQGEQDPIGVSTAYANLGLFEASSRKEIKLINACGHIPWLEQRDIFNMYLTDFLLQK